MVTAPLGRRCPGCRGDTSRHRWRPASCSCPRWWGRTRPRNGSGSAGWSGPTCQHRQLQNGQFSFNCIYTIDAFNEKPKAFFSPFMSGKTKKNQPTLLATLFSLQIKLEANTYKCSITDTHWHWFRSKPTVCNMDCLVLNACLVWLSWY